MTGFLRFIGILNAAIWLGGSVFFTFVAGQAPFSPEMKELLGPGYYPYFSGAIAQIGIARFFSFQLACAIIALAHLGAEWLYQERRNRKVLLWMLVTMLAFTLVADYWLQPKMRSLHKMKYAQNYSPVQRDAAARSFGMWHGIAMTMNLFMLGGLVIYLVQMSRPPETARFVSPGQFRG
jgi:hypothetical protein